MKPNLKRYSNLLFLVLAALLLRLTGAYFNPGFFAVDDFALMKYSVPAQHATHLDDLAGGFLSATNPIRSPVPEAVVGILSRQAYHLGLTDPMDQIRFIYGFLGIFSLVNILLGYRIMVAAGHRRMALFVATLFSFHFLFPYFSTRTLIEFMAVPFFLASLLFLIRFDRKKGDGGNLDLFLAVGFLSLASVLRFQAGVVFPVIAYYAWKHGRFRHVPVLLGSSLFFFMLTGAIDLLFGKGFHESLIAYFEYNLYHSSEFGTSPFYTYIPTIFLVGFGPFLIAKFKNFPWKKEYGSLMPALLYAGIFILVHSLIPHKEERFMATILPVIVILVTPLILFFPIREHKIRWALAASFNFFILGGLLFFPSQASSINLVRFFHHNTKVNKVVFFEDSMSQLPMNYSNREGFASFRFVNRATGDIELSNRCDEVLVVREHLLPHAKGQIEKNRFSGYVFYPAPLDRLMYILNPRANSRRSSALIYFPLQCSHGISFNDYQGKLEKLSGKLLVKRFEATSDNKEGNPLAGLIAPSGR